MVVSYSSLPPETKLIVLGRWMEYCIDKRCNRILNGHTGKCPVLALQHFYSKCCPDIRVTGKMWAIRKARTCFYCNCELIPSKCAPGVPDDPRQATIDHFYPKKHPRRRRGVLVVACYSCNNWKGGKDPSQLPYAISTSKTVPAGWGDETIKRIRAVLNVGEPKQIYYF